jgi:DNA-3-methyladenine glycosylase II
LKSIDRFSEKDFIAKCKQLAKKDADLRSVIQQYEYPPLWKREQGFETLIHIILEQQVSLASAKAALDKLKEKIITITPENLLLLTDAELKACYFSRQKIIYSRELATVIISQQLKLDKLATAPDEMIRQELTKIKGIGHWTVDVYLMMALQRSDLFPVGDIALIKSIKQVKQLPVHTTREEIIQLAESWRPNRTIAAFILWHAYLSKRKSKT